VSFFFWWSKFRFLILQNFWTKVGLKMIFRIREMFVSFGWILFSFPLEIPQQRYWKFFSLYTCITHNDFTSEYCLKDLFDDISIPKFFCYVV
jgi:preprotein translocase subunit Sec63